jgi:hypothetical protein
MFRYTYVACPVEHTFEYRTHTMQEWTSNYHIEGMVNVFFV